MEYPNQYDRPELLPPEMIRYFCDDYIDTCAMASEDGDKEPTLDEFATVICKKQLAHTLKRVPSAEDMLHLAENLPPSSDLLDNWGKFRCWLIQQIGGGE